MHGKHSGDNLGHCSFTTAVDSVNLASLRHLKVPT